MTQGKPPAKPVTILFVDDEPSWLKMIKTSLSNDVFRVMTAESGEAALKALKRRKPDLILSDVRMPAMNGFDLFEKVKSDPRLKHVPYVFMSSIDDYDAKKTARDLGADDYVEKPIDTEQVKHIVLDLLFRFKQQKVEPPRHDS